MAKTPLAKDPDADRSDRRTRIASGPAPMPMRQAPFGPPQPPAAPAPPVAAPPNASAAAIRKTQISVGAPPVPGGPPVTHKKHVQPTPAAPPPSAAYEATLPPPGAAEPPSFQETVVGPAPLPPGMLASPQPQPQPDPAAEAMLAATGLFDDDDDDTGPRPAMRSPGSGRAPTGSQPLVDVDAATMPPPGAAPRPALAIADTQFDLAPARPPAAEPADRRPTTDAQFPSARDSRVGTQMHGTEGLAAPPADAPKIRLIPGKVIPGTRYLIRRWLGEGGMGVVYEVEHADIERRSALKILRFDLSQQPQMAQVFRDEARAVSRLGSPNIVEVYDFGELPDGRLFFAMELLEGTDLVPPDEQTGMDPSRLIAILRQVCKGLAKAHEAGVVHRDVKPENIIVSTIDGREDTAKIVDFGISAMLAAGEQQVGIAGTPHYMAPEQVLGEAFDGRLDIYALGVTAYELLTGRPPFDAEEVEALLQMQLHAAPQPPSQMRPDLQLPPHLEAVVMRCLAKQPHQRFADMADLEAALCEAQIADGLVTGWDDLPVPALADQERYQRIVARMPNAPKPQGRSWLWPIVAGTSTLAAAGLAGFLLFGGQPTDEDKDAVEQLTIEARDAASKAAWVVPPPNLEGQDTALRKVIALEDLEGSAEDLADERAEELRHEFSSTLIANGDRLWDGARDFAREYYAWALLFEDNELAFERANIDLRTLETLRKRAIAGEFNEAERLIAGTAAMAVEDDPEQLAAITEAVNAGLEDPDNLAPSTRESIARAATSSGIKLPRARRGSGVLPDEPTEDDGGAGQAAVGEPAADDGEIALEGGDEGEIVADTEGGELDPEQAKTKESRTQRHRRAVTGLNTSGGAKIDPKRSNELTKQADDKRKQGLRSDAKTLYGQAIAANPNNGDAHLGLALVHFDQGSYHKARKSAQRAVQNSPRNGRAHKVLGDAFYKELRYSEALTAYQNAAKLGVNVKSRIEETKKYLGG